MKVKVRKVGNSMVLTVPNAVAEEMALYEGQEFEVGNGMGILEYKPIRKKKKVDWDRYRLLSEIDTTNGKSPEEYIADLRSEERDPWND